MTGYTPDFDWNPSRDADHSIVVRGQPAIAVYLNPHDEVVIRQEGQYDPSDDHFVYVTKPNALMVARAVLEAAGVNVEFITPSVARLMIERADIDWRSVNEDFSERASPEETLPPKDRTAAERQRRHRANKRNGVTVTAPTVTERDDAPRLELVG
jgi:hypothetical protein